MRPELGAATTLRTGSGPDVDDALTGMTLSRADYHSLVSACGASEPLPGWAAWHKFQIQAAGRALKRGESPEPWALDLADFLAWCRRVNFAPCLEGLKVYAGLRQARVEKLPGAHVS